MMNEIASSPPIDKQVASTRKVRTIIGVVMVAIAILVLMIVMPYLLEKRIAGKIVAVGGSIYFVDRCPNWIPKQFHDNVTVFNRVTRVAFGIASSKDQPSDDEEPQVTDEQLKHLEKLKSLDELWLKGTKVTNISLAHIRKISNLSGLYIQGTQITDEGLPLLKTMTSLKRLTFDETQTTPEGRAKLRKSLPDCKITPDP